MYEYFRKKGFIVKSGLNFGLDYTIYRDSPLVCHSEMCAYAIDAVSEEGKEEGSEVKYEKEEERGEEQGGEARGWGRLSWLQLSTLTRVMPDVMKTLLLCYVLPAPTDASSSSSSSKDGHTPIDLSSIDCLERLTVRPVTSLVRRQPSTMEVSVGETHEKYRRGAGLRFARHNKTVVAQKNLKARRDITETREKRGSHVNRHFWGALTEKERSDKEESISLLGQVSSMFQWATSAFFGQSSEKSSKGERGSGDTNKKRKRRERDDENHKKRNSRQ